MAEGVRGNVKNPAIRRIHAVSPFLQWEDHHRVPLSAVLRCAVLRYAVLAGWEDGSLASALVGWLMVDG